MSEDEARAEVLRLAEKIVAAWAITSEQHKPAKGLALRTLLEELTFAQGRLGGAG